MSSNSYLKQLDALKQGKIIKYCKECGNKIENLKTHRQVYCDVCSHIIKKRIATKNSLKFKEKNKERIITDRKQYYQDNKERWRQYALEKGNAKHREERSKIKNLDIIKDTTIIKTCKQCGKEFGIYKYELSATTKGIYCSQACKQMVGKVLTTCQYCKKEFYGKLSRIITNKDKYCSWDCRIKDTGSNIICLGCGKEFRVKKHRLKEKKFCSMQCRCNYEAKLRTKACGFCGKIFTPKAGSYKVYCSKECQSSWLANRNREWLEKGVYKKANNKFETAICERILKSGYVLDKDFYWQKHIVLGNNHFVIDFVFSELNLYLNANGDYWHYNKNNPKIVKKSPNKDQIKHINSDIKLKDSIKDTDIILKEVWEFDFYKDKTVVDKILAEVITERNVGRNYLMNLYSLKEEDKQMSQEDKEQFFNEEEVVEIPDYAKAIVIAERMRDRCGIGA